MSRAESAMGHFNWPRWDILIGPRHLAQYHCKYLILIANDKVFKAFGLSGEHS